MLRGRPEISLTPSLMYGGGDSGTAQNFGNDIVPVYNIDNRLDLDVQQSYEPLVVNIDDSVVSDEERTLEESLRSRNISNDKTQLRQFIWSIPADITITTPLLNENIFRNKFIRNLTFDNIYSIIGLMQKKIKTCMKLLVHQQQHQRKARTANAATTDEIINNTFNILQGIIDDKDRAALNNILSSKKITDETNRKIFTFVAYLIGWKRVMTLDAREQVALQEVTNEAFVN